MGGEVASLQPPPPAAVGLSVGELSACLMCADAEELRRQCGWEGAEGGSRLSLLRELHAHIPPELLPPESRLQTLLQQAPC